MNPFLNGFTQGLGKRYNKDSVNMTHGQWMCQNTTLNKKPFNFSRYPFQEAIANDMHENLDCIKPSQVGLTEIQIRKALSILSRMDHKKLIYTMPDDKMFKRISKTRILTIVDNDKAFRRTDNVKNSMGLIQIGTSFLYVTGSTEGDATSIDADFLFNDEVDLTDQTMLALFSSRLQGSEHRIKQRFSTPTYAGFGIQKGFASSDQHEYMIKCRACNHYQVPLFTKDFIHIPGVSDKVKELTDLEPQLLDSGVIDLDNIHLHCEKCRRKLNMSDYERRQWVPKFPNRVHHRGYRVGPFSTHTLTPRYVLTQLFEYKRRNNMKGFKNTVLGLTHDQGNNRLSLEQIQAVMVSAARPTIPKDTKVFMGVDVGMVCNITLGFGSSVKDLKPFHFETVNESDLADRIVGLRSLYNIVSGCIDRYPYTPMSNALRDATAGLIMPVEYGNGKEFNTVKDEFGIASYLRISRTMLLDAVADGIRKGTWQMSGYGDDKETIETHLQDMVREECSGEEEPKWVKLNGNDHYFHSLAYLVAAVRNYEFLGANQEFSHTDDDILASDVSVENEKFWGGTDLIGFAPGVSSNKNIITRY